jgi:hypothetical protein
MRLAASTNDALRDLAAIGLKMRRNISLTDEEQRLSVLDRLAALDQDLEDLADRLGLDLVHHLHRLDDADGRLETESRSHRDERLGLGRGSPVERPDHRTLELDRACAASVLRRARGLGRLRNRERRRRGHRGAVDDSHDRRRGGNRSDSSSSQPYSQASPLVVDLELADLAAIHQADQSVDQFEVHAGGSRGERRALSSARLGGAG